MSKSVTLRLDDEVYEGFRQAAEAGNRSLSNFIVTATLRFIEQRELVSESEMGEIRGSEGLTRSVRRGHADAHAGRGRFVE
jgi:predicted transcriptional regulator